VVTARIGLVAVALLAPTNVSAQDLAAGQQLYEARCGKCHGMRLEGQQDWMKRLPSGRLPAPPHDETGHTWHHTDEQLLKITLEGLASIAPGYETDMPAFADILNEAQVRSIFDYIKSWWPDRVRDAQKARSEVAKE
jgi:mono/diheme cytochrome c family protein